MTRPIDDDALRRLVDLGRPDDSADTDGEYGRYRPLREIGRGGMGIVYEAHDPSLGRSVALKVLVDSAGLSPTLRQRFAREALAAARLSHPHIAAVYEATPEYIAMQLIDGIALDRLDLGPRRAARLMITAAEAVEAAHDGGIIHRDLKPSNFMVERADTETPHLFVLDFGLAKERTLQSSISVTGHLLGTPAFMAPEQARGETRAIDERTDVYGLGATLYALVAGTPPYPGDDLVQVLAAVREGAPTPLRKASTYSTASGEAGRVDRDLETIVQKAMAKEPERRYQRAADFAADLRRWLNAEPIRARRPSLNYRLRKFAERRSGPLKAALGAAIVTGIGATWFLASERAARVGTEEALKLSTRVGALVRDADDAFGAGQIQVHDEKLRRAVAICEASLADRDVAHGRFLLGRLQFRRKEYEAAIAALDRALALDPTLDEARFLRGLVFLEYAARPPSMGGPMSIVTGHLIAQARTDLRIHLTSDLSFRVVDVLYGEARLAMIDGDVDSARSKLEAIVNQLDPKHVEALRALADVVRPADQALAIRLDGRAMDLERGAGHAATGTLDPGAAAARLLPDSLPTLPIPRNVSGPHPDALAAALGSLVAAEAKLERARVGRAKGRIEPAIADWRSAIDDYDRALTANSSLVVAFANRGVAREELARLFAAQGRTLESVTERLCAIDDFSKALDVEPCAAAWVNRAAARLKHAEHLSAAGLTEEAARTHQAGLADYRAALAQIPAVSPLRDRAEAALRIAERESR